MLDTKDNIKETIKELNEWIEQFQFTEEEIDSHELDYLEEDEAL